jgi:hypothetical protein
MKIVGRSVRFLSASLIVLFVGVACVPSTSPAPLPVAATPPISPLATPAPASAATLTTDSLIASVAAGLPPGAFEGVAALPLDVPPGQRPLWAVHSYGMRNFDLKPSPDHFIAIYTQDNGAWQELARLALVNDDVKVAGPDYLGENGVTQVQIAPGRIWLQVEGGAGAHSGVFDLVSFDGSQLSRDLNAFAPSPGVGRVQDVNGDGQPDVIINASDPYVFCYACGVVKIDYVVYNWDEAQGQFVDVPLQDMLIGQSGHPGRAANNEAVMLARAGLWKDAAPKIVEAQQISANMKPPFSNAAIDWNYGIIKLTAAAMAKHAKNSGYPLLSNVFYGDYAAAVDLMRPYPPAQIFTSTTPLVVGTIAENWLPQLTQEITASATSALQAKPDLAAAYFLRGWAEYLADPVKLLPQAKSDVAKAATLAPNDALYKQSAAFLAQPVSAAKLPAVKSPTVKPSTTTPKPATATPVPQSKRIQFAPGATSGEVKGQVGPGQIDEYVLKAQAGQWMLVDIFSSKSDVLLAVTGLGDGQPYLRSAAGSTSWQGRLPATQDYSLKAVSSGAAAPYTLQATIPARIAFKPGATGASVEGKLVAQDQDEYVLKASKGQKMIATIQSPGNDVLLEIYGFEDGQPLVRVPMGATTWTGVLPATQDYSIKAVAAGGPTSYKMDVTVK